MARGRHQPQSAPARPGGRAGRARCPLPVRAQVAGLGRAVAGRGPDCGRRDRLRPGCGSPASRPHAGLGATRVRWVLSVPDEGFSVIAGSVAARLAGVPHVVMVFDLWQENAYTDVQRAVAARLEPRILRGVGRGRRLLPADSSSTSRAKYGIEAVDIPTPVEPRRRAHRAAFAADGATASREVLLAGAVYWAQRDAVARLLSLRGRIPRPADGHHRGRGHPAPTAACTPDRSEPTVAGSELRRRLAVRRRPVSRPQSATATTRRSCGPPHRRGWWSTWRPVARSWSTRLRAPTSPSTPAVRTSPRLSIALMRRLCLAALRRVLEDGDLSVRAGGAGAAVSRCVRHDAARVGSGLPAAILDGLHGGGHRPFVADRPASWAPWGPNAQLRLTRRPVR